MDGIQTMVYKCLQTIMTLNIPQGKVKGFLVIKSCSIRNEAFSIPKRLGLAKTHLMPPLPTLTGKVKTILYDEIKLRTKLYFVIPKKTGFSY